MAIHKLKPADLKKLDTPAIMSDGGGLYLRVRKGGSASWVFIWKRDGKRFERGLGSFGGNSTAPVSLPDARTKAADIRGKLSRGEPVETDSAKSHPRGSGETFADLIDEVIELQTKHGRNERVKEQWRSRLVEFARNFPHKPIAKATRSDVAEAILDKWNTAPETARRVLGCVAVVFDYAIAHGKYHSDNPATLKGPLIKLLPKLPEKQAVHHDAVAWADMPAVMAHLRAETGVAARAVEFIALTAVRAGEARGAVADEFDLEAATWVIPAERTKSNREHRVPLSDRAVTIIKGRMQEATGQLMFEGQTEGQGVSEQSLLRALRAAAGGTVTTHGLRSTWRDWGGSKGYDAEALERGLAHAERNRTVAAYRREDMLDQRRPIMKAWSEFCASEQ